MDNTLKTELFEPIDFLFAEHLLKNGTETQTLFLAYLLKAAREGHICTVVNQTTLSPPLHPELDDAVREGARSAPSFLFQKFLVKKGDRHYLARNWECEQTFLTHLEHLKASKPTCSIPHLQLDNVPLQEEQKKAIQKAARQPLTLICGGPGTGKTYTAATLIKAFYPYIQSEIVVAAPTGKAAANIKAALGPMAEKCTIKTLHSLLTKPKLYADLVLVDEGSMIGSEIMAKLFKAIKEGARLVLLGDKDQLPPVESGHFFADLAKDQALVAELKVCLRAELQSIVELAAKVKKGEQIATKPLPELSELIPYVMSRKVQVLTPLRKGPYGVERLNQLLYQEHQKLGHCKIPIMITVNDPSLDLYNGDTGILDVQQNRAYFSSEREFPEYVLPHYTYAYVLSVHKSQGSEYDKVMVLLPEGSEYFGREMLYTAITRAKKEIEILGDPKVIESVVSAHAQRVSGVC